MTDANTELSLDARAAAREAVEFALCIVRGLSSKVPDARPRVIERAKRDLEAWLLDPEAAGAGLLRRITGERNEGLPLESPRAPMQSLYADGLTVDSISIMDGASGPYASWYDYHGEPLRLIASLIASKVGHPIAIVGVHEKGNGNETARWVRVEDPEVARLTEERDRLRERLRLLAEHVARVAPYVAATVSHGNTTPTTRSDWREAHAGRMASSERQLDALDEAAKAEIAALQRTSGREGGTPA